MENIKSKEEFDAIKDKLIIADFHADWCGPCRVVGPVIEELSTENVETKFVKINIDENQELASRFTISAIPTVLVLKKQDGRLIEVERLVGSKPKSTYEEALNKAL